MQRATVWSALKSTILGSDTMKARFVRRILRLLGRSVACRLSAKPIRGVLLRASPTAAHGTRNCCKHGQAAAGLKVSGTSSRQTVKRQGLDGLVFPAHMHQSPAKQYSSASQARSEERRG